MTAVDQNVLIACMCIPRSKEHLTLGKDLEESHVPRDRIKTCKLHGNIYIHTLSEINNNTLCRIKGIIIDNTRKKIKNLTRIPFVSKRPVFE